MKERVEVPIAGPACKLLDELRQSDGVTVVASKSFKTLSIPARCLTEVKLE
jgi:hypothetical protein